MNVLEAYIQQKKYLTIVISCFDVSLLKEIGNNLGLDFGAKVIDLTDKLKDITSEADINIEDINNQDTNDSIKIIIAQIFPENFFSFRLNYHINISLNKTYIEENKIDQKLINLSKNFSYNVSKYLNFKNFDSKTDIEDNIFDIIMNFIKKRLDNGKYSEKILKLEESKHAEDEIEEDKIDNEILNELSSDSVNPLEDAVAQDITESDIRINELEETKIINTNNFYDTHDIEIKQNGGIDQNKVIDDLTESISEYLYDTILKKIEINGTRILRKKLNI